MDNGGPAFPGKVYTGQTEYVEGIGNRHVMEDVPGMTLRQYAAIKLRVPDSGTDWLDAMITASVRNELAAAAIATVPTQTSYTMLPNESHEAYVTRRAYAMANCMLARKNK